ncbi:hypothetical protein [Patulibacter minatonensis]|uniref:hypothetical protein n=1 Tax=Patulibacter minatonensis TaxID=298163 RepID=UPI00047C4C8E|nr:hypothetical protein [Patulibacter minatonensis]
MRRSPIALLVLSAALAASPAAGAAEGPGATSPFYPGNELHVDAPDTVVGGSVLTDVGVEGVATWNENPTTSTTTSYTFSLYVQDPTVSATCGASYGAQLQQSINLGSRLKGTTAFSGFVAQDSIRLGPAVPANQATYAEKTAPFVVRPDLKKVLLCAYQRSVTDDVATASRTVAVEPAACRLKSSSVRRGRALEVRCNVKGPLQVKLRRAGKTRTLKGTIPSTGRKSLSSRSLAKGSYSASYAINGQKLGSQKVRIR